MGTFRNYRGNNFPIGEFRGEPNGYYIDGRAFHAQTKSIVIYTLHLKARW
jgi:hypothetical protein